MPSSTAQRLLFKAAEEAGSSNKANCGNKADQSQILHHLGNRKPEVTEHQRHDQNAGGTQAQPFDMYTAQGIAQHSNAKNHHNITGEHRLQPLQNFH